MALWTFCDNLGAPQLGCCTSMTWWHDNKEEVQHWFDNEGKGVGAVVSDHMIYVYPNQRTLFLLRFGR